MRAVRIWFTKLGRLQYISHLDMNRLMTRIIKRTDIPVWYTEGFNPHPYITFLLPLSLFIQSECEIIDIRITDDDYSLDRVAGQLNAVMPDGMRIVRVAEASGKATEIAFSQYDILIDPEGKADAALRKINECISGDELIIVKKQKQGKKKVDREVNLIDEIHSYVVFLTDDKKVKIEIILPSGTTKSVNPRLFTDALVSKAEIKTRNVSVTRKRIMNEKLEDFR